MRNFIVTIDGKQFEVGVEEVGGEATTTVVAPVVKKEEVKAPVSAPASGTKFTSPMPGMIKKLCFENGAKVKKGDVIVILEAMKMDNDLNAPCDGVITYSVSQGANVETGAVIAVIG